MYSSDSRNEFVHNVYLVDIGDCDYDEYSGFVVVASDVDHARQIILSHLGKADRQTREFTEAAYKLLGPTNSDDGIVLSSFHAG